MFKTSYNMNEGIDFPDMSEKLVAQSLSTACTFNEAGNIYKFRGGVCKLRRFYDLRDFLQPFIGDRYNADVGINRAKWIIGNFGACGRQGIKDG